MFENTSNHCYHRPTDFSADGLHWDGLAGDNKGEMTSCLDSQISGVQTAKYEMELHPTFLLLIGLTDSWHDRRDLFLFCLRLKGLFVH